MHRQLLGMQWKQQKRKQKKPKQLFFATPEPDDIKTQRENYNEDYASTEETDMEINQNPNALPVENNID